MYQTSLVIFFFSGLVLSAPKVITTSSIIGGIPVPNGTLTFAVSLRDKTDAVYCCGSLITRRYVATAAHCTVNKSVIKVGVGSVKLSEQKLYDVDEIIAHPDFGIVKMYHDIALLRLKEFINLGPTIQLINFNYEGDLEGKEVTATAWSRTSVNGSLSPKLLYLKKKIISNDECAKYLRYEFNRGQLCFGSTQNSGMCQGDSGSPLLYEGEDGKSYVVGILSWGIPCARGYPDVFTRVSHYKEWIIKTIK